VTRLVWQHEGASATVETGRFYHEGAQQALTRNGAKNAASASGGRSSAEESEGETGGGAWKITARES